MNMRFKVGDLARIVVAMEPKNHGMIVEIVAVGPFSEGTTMLIDGLEWQAGADCDYFCKEPGIARDYQLEPIYPREQPISLTRTCEEGVEV